MGVSAHSPVSPGASGRRQPRLWAAYAAAATAFVFAAVSLYWALGGTAGLDTIGGQLTAGGRAHDPAILTLVWAAVVLKVVGGLLPLALVQQWGRLFPRWVLLSAAWAGAALLTSYGAVQVTAEALVQLGVIKPAGPVDWPALRWHMLLWDPWFLIWGLLLGAAALEYGRGGYLGRRQDITGRLRPPGSPPGEVSSQ